MRCSFCQSEIGAYGITSGGTLICHKCNTLHTVVDPYGIGNGSVNVKHDTCQNCKKQKQVKGEIDRQSYCHDCYDFCNKTYLEIKEKNNPKDAINPSHYTSGGIETIDYLQAKLTGSEYEGFLRGNVLKYVSRYSLKNGLEDLKKAEWYLKRLIEVKSSDTLKKTDS
jgi:hypothetical protein